MQVLNERDVSKLSEFTRKVYHCVLDQLRLRFPDECSRPRCRFEVIEDESVLDPGEWYYVLCHVDGGVKGKQGITLCFGECPQRFAVSPLQRASLISRCAELDRSQYDSEEAFLADLRTTLDRYLKTSGK
jgi:hypothetical protein